MRRVRGWLEYSALWMVLKIAGLLPRVAARRVGSWCAHFLFALQTNLKRTAEFNLALAFPEWTQAQRRETVQKMVTQLGWMAGEFSQFPKYSRANISTIIKLEGHENFLAARANGKGVLILTGHIGAWELSPYAHALYGYPLSFLARAVENSKVDQLVNRYRGLAGNEPIEKNRAAREMLRVLGRSGTIGILADQNTLAQEGVFVDFFGIPACTTSGLARIALRTGAPVVPGYVLWDELEGVYRLCFEPKVDLVRSGDEERDVLENTARFAKVIERVIREHPEQWVWVHKRWKTRPPGESPLYK